MADKVFKISYEINRGDGWQTASFQSTDKSMHDNILEKAKAGQKQKMVRNIKIS